MHVHLHSFNHKIDCMHICVCQICIVEDSSQHRCTGLTGRPPGPCQSLHRPPYREAPHTTSWSGGGGSTGGKEEEGRKRCSEHNRKACIFSSGDTFVRMYTYAKIDWMLVAYTYICIGLFQLINLPTFKL